MNPAARVILILCTLAVSASCGNTYGNGPLPGLIPSQVSTIEISNRGGAVVRFTEASDIRFILEQFALTEARAEGKVNPELTVVVRPVSSPSVTLRLERGNVGPNVPASDVVTRWYFKNEALYAFIQSAFSRTGLPGAA